MGVLNRPISCDSVILGKRGVLGWASPKKRQSLNQGCKGSRLIWVVVAIRVCNERQPPRAPGPKCWDPQGGCRACLCIITPAERIWVGTASAASGQALLGWLTCPRWGALARAWLGPASRGRLAKVDQSACSEAAVRDRLPVPTSA